MLEGGVTWNNLQLKIEHRVKNVQGTIFYATFLLKLATQDEEYLESWLV